MLIEHEKILLLSRVNTGYEDGNYSVVAGHLERDESVTEPMSREALEEAGIQIRQQDMEVAHVMHRKATDSERIDLFIRARSRRNDPKNVEPDKCDDLSWFPLDDLPHNTVPYVRQGIDMIKAAESYSEHGW